MKDLDIKALVPLRIINEASVPTVQISSLDESFYLMRKFSYEYFCGLLALFQTPSSSANWQMVTQVSVQTC
jgi:hypothetical protein